MAHRVLIAQFMHETNTFSVLPTTLDDYRRRWLVMGEELATRFAGTRTEIGCHHAEQNALANALHKGVSVAGCALVVTLPPCLACARLIHHAGVELVVVAEGTEYDMRGVEYLREHNVTVRFVAENTGAW